MTPATLAQEKLTAVEEAGVQASVAREVYDGLHASPKTLSPWLFYDEAGSNLFERITELPEYYLTRTERSIFALNAEEIIRSAGESRASSAGSEPAPILTLIELGAGTATKTGLLLSAAVQQQGSVVYQPVDVSETALAEATENILNNIPGVSVRSQVADYTSEPLPLDRLPNTRTLALYIGSSIGNFSPASAVDVLSNLRAQLKPDDMLLLGTDLAPGSHKSVADLLAAYDDAAGTTAKFNLNVLKRVNRELDANFDLDLFRHVARWNAAESRMEMHLESLVRQAVRIPANAATPELIARFRLGETIHTENSYKFTSAGVTALLERSGFTSRQVWSDPEELFAVTLAVAV